MKLDAVDLSRNASEAGSSRPSRSAIDSATFEAISALLTSPQFETIYAQPYRGTDEDVMRHLRLVDEFVDRLESVDLDARFYDVVEMIDVCMIDNLNVPEARSLIRALARRDPQIFGRMPRTRAMLIRVMNAIEFSKVMAPETLRRIGRDVKRYQQQFGGGDL